MLHPVLNQDGQRNAGPTFY